MATGILLRALLVTLTLETRLPPHERIGTRATASPTASQRTTAALAALTAAHTTHSYSSGACFGPFTAPLALSHDAPHTQILEPAQPDKGTSRLLSTTLLPPHVNTIGHIN